MIYIFIIVIYLTFAYPNNIPEFSNTIDLKNIKRQDSTQTSDECQYINSLFDQDESYNCCERNDITCENGHITKM